MSNTTCCNLTTNDLDLIGLEQRANHDLAEMITDNNVGIRLDAFDTCPLENSEMGKSVHYHVTTISYDNLNEGESFEDAKGLRIAVLAEDISLTDD